MRTHLEGLPQREIGEEYILLLHVADSSARSFCQPLAIQPDLTTIHANTARQTVQQCRFAATLTESNVPLVKIIENS